MNKESFLELLPNIISRDEKLDALARITADLLDSQYAYMDLVDLYAHIDTLPESLLDILARDLKVDWWNNDYTIEEKRATLKSSWIVHKRLGTKGAVVDALSNVYGSADLVEWFDYDGEPYHFKLLINSDETITDRIKLDAVVNKIKYYKNVRSIFDKVQFHLDNNTKRYLGLALQEGSLMTVSNIPWIDSDETYLVDTDNSTLVDENGNVLFD